MPLIACGCQDARDAGLTHISALVPSGAKGVLLK
jgi:hypothetical protein